MVADLAGRVDEIRQAAGKLPDMGAHRAAELLADRFPTLGDITPGAVVELARKGLLPVRGEYKGSPLYCGRALEAFTDRQALATAAHDGELRTADQAAAYLKVRRADFDHLTRAGWLEPAGWGYGRFQARSRESPSVPLFRTGDLDVLAEHPGIDWEAVRATPKGRPSPLATLTSKAGR